VNPPQFSEQAISLEVAERCGNDWRFVADTGQWIHWNGTFWELDRRNAIAAPIAAICCANAETVIQVYGAKKGEGLARSLASDKTNRAVLSRLSRDQRLVLTHDQLDAHKNLLGIPTGFVDLETCKEYAPERDKLITMVTSVVPAPEGTTGKVFEHFLSTTYPLVPGKPEPNEEIIAFLRRYKGYSLTGEVGEHTCVFLLGSGGNGKGIFTHAIEDVAGDYATVINAETLMERPVERHRSEFAVLRGKRLIFCREVSPGKYWDYAKLMGLVGGDPIEANYMRQNPFTFRPRGKLTIEANNRPNFRVVTPAVDRRLALVRHPMRFIRKDKMAQLIKEHPELKDDPRIVEADLTLEKRLKDEYPIILRWMIDGAHEWYHEGGLRIPASVISDTNEYLRDQDDLAAWMVECCVRLTDGSGGRRQDLFESFSIWLLRRNQKPITYREFGNHLKDIHGFNIVHQNYGDQIVGLDLTDLARADLKRHRDAKKAEKEQSSGSSTQQGSFSL
jgi:putative DNA primase/helicase